MTIIDIYTDGSCLENPGKGGWAAIFVFNHKEIDRIGGNLSHTTNNVMEIMASICALQKCTNTEKKPSLVKIHTDSNYLKNGITSWIHNWKKNNWLTSEKKPVKNKELWMELDELTKNINIEWLWIKAHNGNIHNENADLHAKAMAEKADTINNNETQHKHTIASHDTNIYSTANDQINHNLIKNNSIHISVSYDKKANGKWSATFTSNNSEINTINGHSQNTTQSEMEIIASISALKKYYSMNIQANMIIIYINSNYLKNGITSWIHNWKKNNWLTSEKKPVKNKELWMELDELTKNINIEWKIPTIKDIH